MSIFGNLTNEGLEEAQDRLGGFSRLESDAYLGKIKMAYAGKAASGAQFVAIIFGHGEGAKEEYRETFYITNKKGENFYIDADKKKQPLPGFTVIDDLCQVITGHPLNVQETEEKTVNVYDPEAKKELPKAVPVLVGLLEGEVTLGIIKQTVNKQVKNGAGEYVDTDETRDENVVEKVFHHPSNMTVVEAKRGSTQAAFYGSWVEKNRGVTRDKTKKTGQGGKAGKPGMPPTAGAANAAAKGASLFGPKS